MQHIDTYGLILSPILANFQKIPNILFISLSSRVEYPCLLRSMTAGIWACMYVHVQINRSMTSSKLSKLNNADIFSLLQLPPVMSVVVTTFQIPVSSVRKAHPKISQAISMATKDQSKSIKIRQIRLPLRVIDNINEGPCYNWRNGNGAPPAVIELR